MLDTYSATGFDFNYDAAFTLGLDTIIGGQVKRTSIQVPAYNPATHPESGLALELNGYLSGSWYDPTRGGEGIQFEVGERPNGTRYVLFAWFTYGQSGEGFWLVGNVDVPLGARSVSVPTTFFRNGGFAGNFTPSNLVNKAWGTVTFSFPSCNVMTLQFNGNPIDPEAPSGTGTRSWTRLTSTNGFVCS